MSSIDDDLKRLTTEMDTRLQAILKDAPPDIKKKMEETRGQRPPGLKETYTLDEIAAVARRAVDDLEAARAKADRNMADYEKSQVRFNVPVWLAGLAIAGFVAFLAYAASTHS
jgi:hypothetical protein